MNPKYHWFSQRITAIVITILFVIFLCLAVNYDFYYDDYRPLYYFGILGVAIGLWHGLLGVQTICEDYITSEFRRKVTLAIISVIVYVSLFIGATFTILDGLLGYSVMIKFSCLME